MEFDEDNSIQFWRVSSVISCSLICLQRTFPAPVTASGQPSERTGYHYQQRLAMNQRNQCGEPPLGLPWPKPEKRVGLISTIYPWVMNNITPHSPYRFHLFAMNKTYRRYEGREDINVATYTFFMNSSPPPMYECINTLLANCS